MTEAPTCIAGSATVSPPALKWLTHLAAACVAIEAICCPRLLWPVVLLAGLYILGLSLGSAFFLAVQSVCNAQWSRPIEFIPRRLALLLPWAAAALVPALTLGLPQLYEWSHAGRAGYPALRGFKLSWLSPGFFWARSAVYLVVWIVSVRALAVERRRPRLSALFIVVFAVTFVAASFDWIMSIDADWFSTIFGVYHFTGAFLSALALITLLLIVGARSGGPGQVVDEDRLHDLGRLIFGFSCFWAYIWFSQYMLIWYSNLPEETGYYALRHASGWQILSFLNVLANWGVPFVALISRPAKRNPGTLLAVCSIVLVGHALDLGFMILPPFVGHSPGALLGMLIALVPAAFLGYRLLAWSRRAAA